MAVGAVGVAAVFSDLWGADGQRAQYLGEVIGALSGVNLVEFGQPGQQLFGPPFAVGAKRGEHIGGDPAISTAHHGGGLGVMGAPAQGAVQDAASMRNSPAPWVPLSSARCRLSGQICRSPGHGIQLPTHRPLPAGSSRATKPGQISLAGRDIGIDAFAAQLFINRRLAHGATPWGHSIRGRHQQEVQTADGAVNVL